MVEMKTKLKDLEKNIKFWRKQGIKNFKVIIEDFDGTLSITTKE